MFLAFYFKTTMNRAYFTSLNKELTVVENVKICIYKQKNGKSEGVVNKRYVAYNDSSYIVKGDQLKKNYCPRFLLVFSRTIILLITFCL